jgi:TctA family transporter
MISVVITTSPSYLLAVALAGAAVIASYAWHRYAIALAYAALLFANFEDSFDTFDVLFWLVAAVFATVLTFERSRQGGELRTAHVYVTTGALIGALLSFSMSNPSGQILLPVIGCLFAIMLLKRTPYGREMDKRKGSYVNLAGFYGLPAIVCYKLIAMVVSRHLYEFLTP